MIGHALSSKNSEASINAAIVLRDGRRRSAAARPIIATMHLDRVFMGIRPVSRPRASSRTRPIRPGKATVPTRASIQRSSSAGRSG